MGRVQITSQGSLAFWGLNALVMSAVTIRLPL